MGIIWCSPAVLAALSRHAIEPVQAVLYSETAHQWSRINPGCPLTKNREGEERWPDQEAISKKQSSAMLRSQEPTMAFMPPKHISTLVYPTPAHSLPYPSKELEFQCQKPPDCGGGERWPIYYAINEKAPLSVTKHSPLNGIAPTLSVKVTFGCTRVALVKHQPQDNLGLLSP